MIIRVNVVLSLTRKMTEAPVAKTSVTINNNSPIYGLAHTDDLASPTYKLTFY